MEHPLVNSIRGMEALSNSEGGGKQTRYLELKKNGMVFEVEILAEGVGTLFSGS